MFDRFLSEDGPVAISCKIPLVTTTPGSPIYPPTFASPKDAKDDKAVYNICQTGPSPFQNCCELDTVGSQANRMEAIFKTRYPDLLPKVEVMTSKGVSLHILDLNHRIADAVLRTTDKADLVAHALREYSQNRNGDPIASILPTSLVFGFWDSRGEHSKAGRLIASTVRATNVFEQTRSSQYQACKPATADVLELNGYDRDDLTPAMTKALQNRGLLDCPQTAALGGVYVNGEIFREVNVNLVDVRALRSATDTPALQRYILGLTLLALVARQPAQLRQGCTLLPDVSKPATAIEWTADGLTAPTDLFSRLDEILEFTRAAATSFLGNPLVLQIEQERSAALIEEGHRDKEAKEAKENGKKAQTRKPAAANGKA